MVKAGLIAGAIQFILAIGLALISPLCTPCSAILVGLAAGYLAGNFDKPFTSSEAMKKGAIAGAIAGAVAIIGQIVGGVINASVVDPATLNQIIGSNMIDKSSLWLYQLGGALCLGLFNVALMAGLGVGGAAIWNSMRGSKQPPVPPAYTPVQ